MINGNVQNHGIVPNHDFPGFCRLVRRNGPDTGAIMTRDSGHFCPANSLPIAIWSIFLGGTVFLMIFPLITPSPTGPQKRILHG